MYRGCTVAVVVPAYDEEGFVGGVVDTLPDFVDRAYVVDDASTDRTWAEIREHAAAANRAAAGRGGEQSTADAGATADGSEATTENTGATTTDARATADGVGTANDDARMANDNAQATTDSVGTANDDARTANDNARTATDGAQAADGGERRVVPIRHDENRGVGGAIATGYRRALADGMDVTAVMNGDGQMDPAILDRIVHPVATGRAGYAKGERLTDPERRASMSRFRLFGNALLTGLTRVATGYWGVTDPQNGYTAISREALTAVDLEACYEGYGFCNDLLAALGRAGVRVADVPMTAVYGDERSGIRYSRFVPGLSALLVAAFGRRLWVSYVVRELHPLVALYGLGAAGVAAGAAGVVGAGLLRAAGVAGAGGAVAGGLAGGLAGFLGAALVALAATFDRAAAGDRVVRVAAEGPTDAPPDGAAAGGRDGDGEARDAGEAAGDGEAGGEGTGDGGERAAGDGERTGDVVYGPEVRADGAWAASTDSGPVAGGEGADR